MNKEWKRTGLPEVKKCRKAKTRYKKRKALQEEFFSRYVIASKLYKEGETEKKEIKNQQELENALLFLDVEGGKFHNQVGNGLYLGGRK
ncbi:MAG: hypothetical protein WED82_02030 [Balneolales bacterium]